MANENQPSVATSQKQRIGFAHESVQRCGILLLICAGLFILINLVAMITAAHLNKVGFGFWGGVVLVLAGACALLASRYKSTTTITALLVVSVLACVVAVMIFIFAGVGLNIDSHALFCLRHWKSRQNFTWDDHAFRSCAHFDERPKNALVTYVRMAMHSLNVVVSALAFVLTVINSILSGQTILLNRLKLIGQPAVIYTGQASQYMPSPAVQFSTLPDRLPPLQYPSHQSTPHVMTLPYPAQSFHNPNSMPMPVLGPSPSAPTGGVAVYPPSQPPPIVNLYGFKPSK